MSTITCEDCELCVASRMSAGSAVKASVALPPLSMLPHAAPPTFFFGVHTCVVDKWVVFTMDCCTFWTRKHTSSFCRLLMKRDKYACSFRHGVRNFLCGMGHHPHPRHTHPHLCISTVSFLFHRESFDATRSLCTLRASGGCGRCT